MQHKTKALQNQSYYVWKGSVWQIYVECCRLFNQVYKSSERKYWLAKWTLTISSIQQQSICAVSKMSFLSLWFSGSSQPVERAFWLSAKQDTCIQIQSQEYRDYSGREKMMEVHLYVLRPSHWHNCFPWWISHQSLWPMKGHHSSKVSRVLPCL